MIVFHGSPNYFGKFKDSKIDSSRDYNPIRGHYFSENMYMALQYRRKYYTDNKFSLAFLQDVTQPISGYLYICEVPDKKELLHLSQEIAEAPKNVQAAISNILKDPVFEAMYIKIRKNNTIGEFIKHYKGYCRVKAIHSMLPNVFRGFKGVYGDPYGTLKSQPEIIIFDAKDIQIKQCFNITQVRSNIAVNPEYNKCDIVEVLFKRFGEYYYASGTDYDSRGVIIFSTGDDCPEIVDEVQTFDELDQNPFVIAYTINKPLYGFSVVEANVNSLNYNPRKSTRPKKASIYTPGDIKAILDCDLDVYTPVRSKILNINEFAEYKRQADKYKDMRQHNPFTTNAVFDCLRVAKVNTLFLQRAETPHFHVEHVTPEKAKEFIKYIQEHKGVVKPIPAQEKQEQKLTDEQIQEATKVFLDKLKPIIQERAKKLYNLLETQETPPPSTEQ